MKGEEDELRVRDSEQDNINKLLQSFGKHLWAEIVGEDISRLQNPYQTHIVSTKWDNLHTKKASCSTY